MNLTEHKFDKRTKEFRAFTGGRTEGFIYGLMVGIGLAIAAWVIK